MIALVAGTRPNFMKIAPVRRALVERGHQVRLVHTGQHLDPSMSAVFFRDLGLPAPDVVLGGGGGSHAEQTAAVMVGVEADLLRRRRTYTIRSGLANCPSSCNTASPPMPKGLSRVSSLLPMCRHTRLVAKARGRSRCRVTGRSEASAEDLAVRCLRPDYC